MLVPLTLEGPECRAEAHINELEQKANALLAMKSALEHLVEVAPVTSDLTAPSSTAWLESRSNRRRPARTDRLPARLTDVKRFRIFVLVLLALLLPMRGAMSATLLCPGGEAPSPTAVVAVQQRHDMRAHHPMHADDSSAHQHASGEAPNDDPSSDGHPSNCHYCASGCCMASIVGTVPSIGQPGLTSSLAYPALTARVPAFQSDGQDRPPRTI